jgi:hypothetical protein
MDVTTPDAAPAHDATSSHDAADRRDAQLAREEGGCSEAMCDVDGDVPADASAPNDAPPLDADAGAPEDTGADANQDLDAETSACTPDSLCPPPYGQTCSGNGLCCVCEAQDPVCFYRWYCAPGPGVAGCPLTPPTGGEPCGAQPMKCQYCSGTFESWQCSQGTWGAYPYFCAK